MKLPLEVIHKEISELFNPSLDFVRQMVLDGRRVNLEPAYAANWFHYLDLLLDLAEVLDLLVKRRKLRASRGDSIEDLFLHCFKVFASNSDFDFFEVFFFDSLFQVFFKLFGDVSARVKELLEFDFEIIFVEETEICILMKEVFASPFDLVKLVCDGLNGSKELK